VPDESYIPIACIFVSQSLCSPKPDEIVRKPHRR
jgi:hypothetical protein